MSSPIQPWTRQYNALLTLPHSSSTVHSPTVMLMSA
jgi:hypothetical protein